MLHCNLSVRLAQESENQIYYKKWVKNQTSGNGLSRRIDVVGCGNAVRKEGRKEREKELMWVAAMQEARRRRRRRRVVEWSFTHIMGVA